MSDKLKFAKGNAKLDKDTTVFSLPAGYTCPGAKLCKSRADLVTGTIKDGPHTQFRCFAASLEVVFKNSQKAYWHNRELLAQAHTTPRMTQLILDSLPAKATKVRVHQGGDFFNQDYFDAWMAVAVERPDILFYAYTKSLLFWVARLDSIPENFVLTASYGGHFDDLIKVHGLRHSVVVFHPDEAEKLGLQIDHDDKMAYTRGIDSFALLLHGIQPKGSAAAAAKKALVDQGIEHAYGRNPTTV